MNTKLLRKAVRLRRNKTVKLSYSIIKGLIESYSKMNSKSLDRMI